MSYILVVEDEEIIRENLREALEAEGYKVNAVASTEEALFAAFANPPLLVLCDVRMSQGDGGFRVLERLRLNEATKNTPFIFLSAAVEKATIRRGMNLGADDYITKPYSREELLESINVRLRRSMSYQAMPTAVPYPYIVIKSPGFPPNGQRFDLESYLMIGRKAECNVRLSDLSVSAIACTLVLKKASSTFVAWINDGAIVKTPTPETRSRYGVWVNGKRIPQQAELKGGEQIKLSPNTSFEYFVPLKEEKIDPTQSSEQ